MKSLIRSSFTDIPHFPFIDCSHPLSKLTMVKNQPHGLLPFLGLILLLSGLLSCTSAQVHHFDFMPNCAGKEDMLGEHLYESQLLATAAKNAIDNIGHDVVAQKLVTSYFKLEFTVVDGRAVPRHNDWNAWAKVKSKPQSFLFCGMDRWT